MVLDEGHTRHSGNVVLAESAVEVREVFPLVVVSGVDRCTEVIVGLLHRNGGEVRLGVAVRIVVGYAVSETAGEGQTLDGSEVGVCDSADGDTAFGRFCGVPADERMTGLGFTDERNCPIETGLGVLDEFVTCGQVLLHTLGELALVSANGEQRGRSDG